MASWQHYGDWTHWDLNPGPSACEADVIPLHHVPNMNLQRRLRTSRGLCSLPRRRNRRENAARPCNARRASDDNAELRASRDGAEPVELHCGARESPLRASTRRSGAPGHAVTLRSSSGEDLWCSMLRCVFLRCLAFAVEAHWNSCGCVAARVR